MNGSPVILIINSGSSSIKFAIYGVNENLNKIYSGKIDRIGFDHSELTTTDHSLNKKNHLQSNASGFSEAADFLINHLAQREDISDLKAIGHRIVFGLKNTRPAIIDEQLLNELKEISAYDPDHLPAEIQLIEKLKATYPQVIQVACFDTFFHSSMPRVAKMLPLPRQFDELGIQRYGFHGISYTYLMQELRSKQDAATSYGRIILAHLGNGASMAAVKDGKCLDTSMGFTPAGGIMMGNRTGDLDPGVAWWFMQNKKMNADQFNHLINHESGLLGVSGISADMHDLLQREDFDVRAAEAINLFCYQAKKCIGAFIAVLGGLDALVFSGGIGENSSVIRSRICENLNYAGIVIDEEKNKKHAFQISTGNSAVKIFIIPTDEELMIARDTKRIYEGSPVTTI